MPRRALRVLHVCPSFHPAVRYGGPITILLHLCRALVREGVDLEVLTTTSDGPDELDVPVERLVDVEGVPVRYHRRTMRRPFDFSVSLAQRLLATAGDYDLIHAAGTFDLTTNIVALASRRTGTPFVVTPYGSLAGAAMQRKSWKKRLYSTVVEGLGVSVHGAAAMHATSPEERADVQRALPGVRVFDVPCGVDVPAALPRVERDPRRIAFLGRLHEIKGFDVLIPALSRVTAVMPDVEAVFAGFDAGGEWAAIERLARAQRPAPRIRYIGPVTGEDKWSFLAGSGMLALTSHSESFGMVVIEALACGTPVVVSRTCPWQAVEDHGAGLWVDRTPENVAAALLRLLGDPALARRMGEAGRDLAKRYSWSSVAREIADRYATIVEGAGGGHHDGEARILDELSSVGFSKVTGVLAPRQVEVIAEETAALLARPSASWSEFARYARDEEWRSLLLSEPDRASFYDFIGLSPRLDAVLSDLLDHPLIKRLLWRMMGPDHRLWYAHIRSAGPGSPPLRLHQDLPGEKGLIILASPASSNEGATMFLPRSHRWPRVLRYLPPISPTHLEPSLTGATGNAGDLYLFDNATWHGRSPGGPERNTVIILTFLPRGTIYRTRRPPESMVRGLGPGLRRVMLDGDGSDG